eukprot:TRINITY_DN8800_c0_g2_i3.p1 TRINITY_DN8800_c0_g2~~TRINITY_DN8800_c0_g2_i3.p1  ORF type:complete len:137 (+),score=5.83 TRINITY_DN8800_c0_g2_i3:3040-3450(+)
MIRTGRQKNNTMPTTVSGFHVTKIHSRTNVKLNKHPFGQNTQLVVTCIIWHAQGMSLCLLTCITSSLWHTKRHVMMCTCVLTVSWESLPHTQRHVIAYVCMRASVRADSVARTSQVMVGRQANGHVCMQPCVCRAP